MTTKMDIEQIRNFVILFRLFLAKQILLKAENLIYLKSILKFLNFTVTRNDNTQRILAAN